jgi:isocitrate lyase
MGVPLIIVARTDAEAAELLDNNGDSRDHPFLLGQVRQIRARNFEEKSREQEFQSLFLEPVTLPDFVKQILRVKMLE